MKPIKNIEDVFRFRSSRSLGKNKITQESSARELVVVSLNREKMNSITIINYIIE